MLVVSLLPRAHLHLHYTDILTGEIIHFRNNCFYSVTTSNTISWSQETIRIVFVYFEIGVKRQFQLLRTVKKLVSFWENDNFPVSQSGNLANLKRPIIGFLFPPLYNLKRVISFPKREKHRNDIPSSRFITFFGFLCHHVIADCGTGILWWRVKAIRLDRFLQSD